jgi:hypothetical protein
MAQGQEEERQGSHSWRVKKGEGMSTDAQRLERGTSYDEITHTREQVNGSNCCN